MVLVCSLGFCKALVFVKLICAVEITKHITVNSVGCLYIYIYIYHSHMDQFDTLVFFEFGSIRQHLFYGQEQDTLQNLSFMFLFMTRVWNDRRGSFHFCLRVKGEKGFSGIKTITLIQL